MIRKKRLVFLSVLQVGAFAVVAHCQGLQGDVNGDGVVNAKDALRLFRIAKGKVQPAARDNQFGDVYPVTGTGERPFGDGKLDMQDAQQMLRMLVGLVPRGEVTGEFEAPEIISFDPASGAPGVTVTIRGRNFLTGEAAQKAMLVTFGATPATFTAVSSSEIRAAVPAGITAEDILVVTPGGEARSSAPFLNETAATGRVVLPAAMQGTALDIASVVGDGSADAQGNYTAPAFTDYPTLVSATPKNRPDSPFFRILFPGSRQASDREINARSTAESLILMQPVFALLGTDNWPLLMAEMQSLPEVDQLAKTIEQLWPQGSDPLNDPALEAALATAMNALADALIAAAPARTIHHPVPHRHSVPAATSRSRIVWPDAGFTDIDWETTTAQPKTVTAKLRFGSAVDYLVRVARLKLDKVGSQSELLKGLENGQAFEREAFSDFTLIPATQVVAEILGKAPLLLNVTSANVLGTIGGVGDIAGSSALPTPGVLDLDPNAPNAVYIIRSFAGILWDKSPNGIDSTTIARIPLGSGDHVTAVVYNLMLVAWDVVTLFVPQLNAIPSSVVTEVLKQATMFLRGQVQTVLGRQQARSASELAKTLYRFAAESVRIIFKEFSKPGIYNRTLKVSGNVPKAIKKVLAFSDLKVTKIVSNIVSKSGSMERVLGMAGVQIPGFDYVSLTPLETAYLSVGHPFGPSIRSFAPTQGKPGDTITLEGYGFAPKPADNTVRLGGVPVEVTSVTPRDPKKGGPDKMEVELAEGIPPGAWRFAVRIPGSKVRHSSGLFSMERAPVVKSLNPVAGFAPGKLGLQSQSDTLGTRVTISGSFFDPQNDNVFFETAAGQRLQAQVDRSDSTSFDLVVRVPAGATAGVGAFVVRSSEGNESKGSFAVYGPPTLQSGQGSSAKAGATLALIGADFPVGHPPVDLAGGGRVDALLVWFTYGNQNERLHAVLLSRTAIQTTMTSAVNPGDAVQIVVQTPAGTSNPVTVTRLAGRSSGSSLQVPASTSVQADGTISFAEAVAWIQGRAPGTTAATDPYTPPFDDVDVDLTIIVTQTYQQLADGSEKFINETHARGTKTPRAQKGHSGHETAYVKTTTIKHLIPQVGDPLDIPQGTISSQVDLDDPNIKSIDVWTTADLPALGVVEEGDHYGLDRIGKAFSDTLTIAGGSDKPDFTLDEPGAGDDTIDGANSSHLSTDSAFGIVRVQTDGNVLTRIHADRVEIRPGASRAGRQLALTAAHNTLDRCTLKQLVLDGATNTTVAALWVDGRNTASTGILLTNGAQRNIIKGTPLQPDGYPHWGETMVRNCTGAGIRLEGATTADNRLESLGIGFELVYDSTKPSGQRWTTPARPCGTGIEILQGAHDNAFLDVSVRSCRGDGIVLSGSGVRNNVIRIATNYQGAALGNAANGANGVHMQSGAGDNDFEGDVFSNGGYGAFIEGDGTEGNVIKVRAASNGSQLQVPYDVLVQGDGTTSPVDTRIDYRVYSGYGAGDAALVPRGVHLHGLRLPANIQTGDAFTCWVDGTDGVVELSDTQHAIVGPENMNYGGYSGTVLLRGKNTQHNLIRNMFFLNTKDMGVRITDGASHNQVHTFLMRNFQGFGIPNAPYGIVIDGGASDNEIIGTDDPAKLTVDGGFGIGDKQTALLLGGGAKNNVVRNVLFSPFFAANVNDHDIIVEGTGTQGNTIRNCALFNPLIIRDGARDTTLKDNWMGFGVSQDLPIHIVGPGTDGVYLYANRILHDPNSPQRIINIDQATRVEIGSNSPGQGNQIPCPKNGTGVSITDSNAVRIVNNSFYGKGDGVFATGSSRALTIGGGDRDDGNTFLVDGYGITFVGVQDSYIQNNSLCQKLPQTDVAIRLEGGCRQVSISRNEIAHCVTDGIQIDGASTTQNTVVDNAIHDNGGSGVHLTHGARLNTVTANSIHDNGGFGILLQQNSNDGISPAVIGGYDPKGRTISGTVPSTVPVGSTIEFFADTTTQGKVFLGVAPVRPSYQFVTGALPPLPPGMNLTATVTDPDGNTSMFAQPYQPSPTRPKAFFVITTTRYGNREILRQFPGEAVGTRLTMDPGIDDGPSLSSDHQQVLWTSNRDGDAEIWVMASDGSGKRNLTNNGFDDYDPAWSPDGQKVAYVCTADGNPEIWVMDANGSNPKQVTHTDPGVTNRHPTWSPDGTQIAYASGPGPATPLPGRQTGGNWEIMVVGVAGGSGVNVTNHPAADDQPAWSPDGKFIAFVSNRDGNPEIYTVQPGGGGLTRLTDEAAEDVTPTWVSDQTLLFASQRSGKWEIYSMQRDGSAVLRLTVSLGLNIQPNAGKQ